MNVFDVSLKDSDYENTSFHFFSLYFVAEKRLDISSGRQLILNAKSYFLYKIECNLLKVCLVFSLYCSLG